MIDELFIDGRKADLGDSGIYLTYRSNIFSDISKIVGDNSSTIKLPKTANNASIFGQPIYPSSDTDAPYRNHNAQIIRDGVMLIDDAVVVVMAVTTDEIEIALAWGVTAQLKKFFNDGNKMNELVMEDSVNWESENNGTENMPFAYYGLSESEEHACCHPVVSVNRVLEAIQETNDIAFQYGATPWVRDNWVLPVFGRKYPYQKQTFTCRYLDNIRDFYYNTMPFEEADYLRFVWYKERSGQRDFDNDFTYWIVAQDEDVQGYEPLYMLPKESHLQFKFKCNPVLRLQCSYEYASQVTIVFGSLRVEDGKNTFDSLMEVKPYQITEVESGKYDIFFQVDEETDVVWFDDDGNVFPDGRAMNLLFKLPHDANQHIYQLVSPCEIEMWSRIAEVQVKGTQPNPNDPFRDTTAGADYDSKTGAKSGIYPIACNLGELEQLKFVKSVMQMAGMFAFIDGNKICFEPFSVLRTNKPNAVDWSKYLLVRDCPDKMEFVQGSEAQKNCCKYGEGKTPSANMDGAYYIDNETLEYERDAVELSFKSFGTFASIARFPMYTYDAEEQDDGTLEYKLVWDEDTNPYIAREYKGIDRYYLSNIGIRWNELLAEHYDEYVDCLNHAKVITENFSLSPVVLAKLDMRVPVYLSQYGAYFAIVSIKTKANNISEVNLIKI